MKFALFMGCKIPYSMEHYGTSTKAVLKKFGVKLVELKFNCCGYPNHDISFESYILSAARNIALAEKKKLNIITPCKCCFGSLKHAEHWLKENTQLKDTINAQLKKEKLEWTGSITIKHILSVLAEDIGIDVIKGKVTQPQKGLKIAAHYGCHALRPSNVMHFDNPMAPTIFEKLIEATGAETVSWARRLDCCGNPLWEKNNEISLKLTRNKIKDAHESGADGLCTACTYCQLQFDNIQFEQLSDEKNMPAVLYTQLLGLSLGLPEKVLGLTKNKIPFN